MFLSRIVRSLLPAAGGLAVAAAALLLAAGPAAAQQPAASPRIPPDAKGWQAAMIQQEYLQARSAQRAPAAPPTTPQALYARAPSPQRTPTLLSVTLAVPAVQQETAVVSVDLRGPDGEVRNFPLEGGREVIQTRKVIVRPGESVTVRLTPSAPAK
jgi:hypothetical protein